MRLLVPFLILFFSNFLNGQIYVGNVQLGSQAAVNEFPAQFPGIKKIYGNLLIGTTDTIQLSDITDLTPLTGLEYADYIFISNNGLLQHLQGLEAMDTLYALTFYNNPKLADLHGLHNLKETDIITLRKNDFLYNMQGLNSLQHATGLIIDRCQGLHDLYGLDSLRSTFFGITIAGNPRLQSLSGMQRLQESTIDVVQNDSLEHLGYFPSLQKAGFNITDNQRLIDFAEMGAAIPDTLNLRLFQNPALSTIEPVKKARWLGITCSGNALLSTISIDSAAYLIADISGPVIQHLQFKYAAIVSNLKVHDCPRLKNLENVLPYCDSILFSYEIYHNDSLETIHEDKGPGYSSNLKVYENPRLKSISGFEALKAVFERSPGNLCFDCGLYLRSPALERVEGFNQLRRGRLFFDSGSSNFNRITGFNAPNAVFDEVLNWSYPPQKVIGFNGAVKVIDQIFWAGVSDTLSVFKALEEMGAGFDHRELRVETGDSCFVDEASFAKLRNMDKVNLSNASFSGYPLHFPALETLTEAGISTSHNLNAFSLQGVYPALKQIKNFGIQDCPQLRSLDGIEGIQLFKQSVWPYGSFVATYDCDSLSDCSAICYLEHHADFIPSNTSDRYFLGNSLYPCNEATSALFWCDTLSVAVLPDPNHESPATARVFPNPSHQALLSVEMGDKEPDGMYYFRVSDAWGRIMQSGTLKVLRGAAVFNAGTLVAGRYQISLWRDKGRLVNIPFIRQ